MKKHLFLTLVCSAALITACSSPEEKAEAESPKESQTAEAQQETEPAGEGDEAIKDVMTKESQTAMTPDQALQKLKEGNARYVKGEMTNRDLGAQVQATAAGQYPFAVVLGCVDSRVPHELVFDQGVGDIFSARVAGNFETEDMLGSMEFATKVAGSKVVVVMGHTSCGAVKGSCDNVQLGHISSLVEEIKPAVEDVTPEGETCSSDNTELVNKIAHRNVELTVEDVRERSEILAEMEKAGDIKIVGAMYDISTGKVEFFE
ncbi:carbonic anhydrase [Persicimonas caeni]|uniref:Carbonic anhydrase n=1 Tax=Persicimonas caeni TaxID=2292766 RepID=A0A4Y6PXK4_PERCE|nr:carbonic anhydrase family protein [Persicimonas caeni]QDG53051.1 carbonic anhydrase [Persicimonas caeni]QED34273.1 carbonic anhydrase [Persicimonas caeni]